MEQAGTEAKSEAAKWQDKYMSSRDGAKEERHLTATKMVAAAIGRRFKVHSLLAAGVCLLLSADHLSGY